MKKQGRLFVLLASVLFSAGTLSGQTRVIKTNALKSNDYGVQYFLPKTLLKVDVEYSITTQQAGQYARYAEKLLGLTNTNIIQEDQTFYELNSVSAEGVGIPDRDASYLVEFKAKTTAPFLYLTEEGLICTINAEYAPVLIKLPSPATSSEQVIVQDPQFLFTEEYLQAGSIAKMAEVLAKQIYRIRESRNDILLGNADNVPRDGEGVRIVLANLDSQEKALVELFTGTSSTEKRSASFELEPQSDIAKEVLFRFSKYKGVVDTDDLSGIPVYINVTALDPIVPSIPDPIRKGKETLSIVYNIPVRSSVEVYYGTEEMYREEIPIAQFGDKQILATSFFDDKKAPVQVFFYPNTGAIKQIVQ
jgi:hypothetical protein